MVKVISIFLEGVFYILTAIIEGCGDLITSMMGQERKTTFDSDFIPASALLSRQNTGLCLDGTRALPVSDSIKNCSIYGASGSGKSSVVLLPSIFSIAAGDSSMCINDPSGELYEKTSGYLAKLGYTVQRIDFSSPERSEGFNPLGRCRTISDIQKVTHLVITNTVGSSKGDPFWDTSSEMLITLMARYLIFYAEPQMKTMANVLRLIETFATHPEKVDALFAATHDEELLGAYKATVVTGDKTMQSIIATSRAALNIFSDPTIIRTTSVDTIDFGRLRKDKVALFICNPIQHIHYYKPLAALFFETLFGEIMSRIPKRHEHSIFCLLDEAVTMRFNSLSTTISNIRKYNASIMLVVQDYQALVALYGASEAHNIRTNTYAQVYLKGQPIDTCKELETILGRFTYTDEKGTEKVRLLMTADEIRKSEEAIILCGNHAPIKAKMTPYYDRMKFRSRTELPPYEPVSKLPNGMPPLIQFPDGKAKE